MSDRTGKPYTPDEDEQILARSGITVRELAQRLGRTRVAISMRKAELIGTRNHKERKKPVGRPRAIPVRPIFTLPVARPAWFENENLEKMMRGR